MALPNPSMVFTAFDTLPASDLNKIVANVEALSAGTGFNSDIKIDSATGITDADSGTMFGIPVTDGVMPTSNLSTGAVIQVVSTGYAAVATGTTVMNDDDTIPVITEGTEFMTQAITPKSAANRLLIEAVLLLAPSAAETINAAIFVGTTTNALAANGIYQPNSNAKSSVIVSCDVVAGSTSELTFRVRAGLGGAGTLTFNGQGGSRRFGDIVKSSIKITEYKA